MTNELRDESLTRGQYLRDVILSFGFWASFVIGYFVIRHFELSSKRENGPLHDGQTRHPATHPSFAIVNFPAKLYTA